MILQFGAILKQHSFFAGVLMTQLISLQKVKNIGKSRRLQLVDCQWDQLQIFLNFVQIQLKSLKNHLKLQSINLIKTNMTSSQHNFFNNNPFIFNQLPLQQNTLAYLLNTPSQQLSYNAEPFQDSTIFFYTTFPNYVPTQYFLYPNAYSTVQTITETTFIQNLQQFGFQNNLVQFPTKSFQSERELRMEQESPSGTVKKEQEISLTQNVFVEKTSEKRKTKFRNKSKDPVFMPHRSGPKSNSKNRHWNQNRNIIPNEISQILSYLHKRGKSQYVLKRVWAKYAPPCEEYSINRFYLLQNHLKGKVGHYCNEASLKFLNDLIEPECKIWPADQQRHYIMLSRILIGHFLREDSIFSILTSKRMRSQKKHEHLRTRRLVTQIVKKVLEI